MIVYRNKWTYFFPGINEVLSKIASNPCHQNRPCSSYALHHPKRIQHVYFCY